MAVKVDKICVLLVEYVWHCAQRYFRLMPKEKAK